MSEWIDAPAMGSMSRWNLGHTFRYRVARGFLEPGDDVLDLGCGAGYGSQIMAQFPGVHSVKGYDLDPRGIELAQKKYGVEGITSFEVLNLDTDAEDLPSCDVAVTFETIEHLIDPAAFLHTLRVKARRIVALSTPWRDTGSPHHKHACFSKDEIFKLMLGDGWSLWEYVLQGPYQIVVAWRV